MPASPSPRPGKPRRHPLRFALGAIAVLVVVSVVVIVTLPASLVDRLLPPAVRASDYSGSLWHGAAGRIVINGHDSGALEWRLHPGELTRLKVGLDATWALGGFSLTASGVAGARSIEASAVDGGGALEDLAALTGMAGWRGTVSVALSRLTADLEGLESIAGDVGIAGLHSANIGNDDDLGGYTLHFDPPGASGTDTAAAQTNAGRTIEGQLSDAGTGPLQVQGIVTLALRSHRGTLTGTVRERPGASAALRQSLEQLAQMQPRDASGSIPLEVEFSW